MICAATFLKLTILMLFVSAILGHCLVPDTRAKKCNDLKVEKKLVILKPLCGGKKVKGRSCALKHFSAFLDLKILAKAVFRRLAL